MTALAGNGMLSTNTQEDHVAFRRTHGMVTVAIVLASWFSATSARGADAPDFERDVAPILVRHCLDCHQPNKTAGGLNLATRDAVLRGGSQGSAVVVSDVSKSLLVARIEAGEMPPPDDKHSIPLKQEQIAVLRNWIAAGAAWPEKRELGLHEKPLDLDAARQFWSFQPVRKPAVPDVRGSRVANPIDAFVVEKLQAAGLELAPTASNRDLLRRMSLDVRGFTPSLDELAEFDAAETDGLDRYVEKMLADPAHGERWARYWLDLVRYADSNGYERDGAKPSVWKYRDYVIAAINADKPYDRFVLEQLAGDELPDATPETVIATGFHALGTWQDEVDPLEAAQYRADEIDDMIRTTAQTFLGITLGCARCHQHKFDPFSMTDYYSVAAILAPLKRPNAGRADRDLPLGAREQIAAENRRDQALAELEKRAKEIEQAKPADAPAQIAALRRKQAELRQRTPDLPRGYYCSEDTPNPPATHLLLSGRASNPGPVMQPRVPAVLTSLQPVFPAPGERTTQRRLTLARWVVSPENPLTARVIVNRVWQHHFGTGLVATSSDFGQVGSRPSHPELLDWLSHWFMHDAGWSLKRLHRLILTSETWRQSVARNDAAARHDPENRLLWRYPYRRLDVEAIRDAMLVVAGNVDRRIGGPAVFLPVPQAAIEAHTDKQSAWAVSPESEIDRRTVYAFVKRTLLVPMLETLDFCDTTQSTERRAVTCVAPQSLTLFNGDFVNRQAAALTDRLTREAGTDPAARIDLAWRLALSRSPTPAESTAMQKFVRDEIESRREESPSEAGRTERDAWRQVCRVLFNLNEFVYPN